MGGYCLEAQLQIPSYMLQTFPAILFQRIITFIENI